MSKKINLHICFTGGTIFMSKIKDLYEPMHQILDAALVFCVLDACKKKLINEKEQETLIKKLQYSKQVAQLKDLSDFDQQEIRSKYQKFRAKIYQEVVNSLQEINYWQKIGIKANCNDSKLGHRIIEYFGFAPLVHSPLSDEGIDSINFDCDHHYLPILNSVLEILGNEKDQENNIIPVPIIVGGTDMLKYYSKLLTEDLKRRGFNSPIIFVSSMKAFGEDPIHVSKLLQLSKKLAEILIKEELAGGYMISANDDEMSNANIFCVNEFIEKITAHKNPAFVGSGFLGVLDDKGNFKKNNKFQAPKRINWYKKDRAKIGQNPTLDYLKADSFDTGMKLANILPPIFANNDIDILINFLATLIKEKEQGENSILGFVINGIIRDNSDKFSLLKILIKKLTNLNLAVILANDPIFNKNSGKIEIDENFAQDNFSKELSNSGAVLMNCDSFRAHILAALRTKYLHPIRSEIFSQNLAKEESIIHSLNKFVINTEIFFKKNLKLTQKEEEIYQNFKFQKIQKPLKVEYVPSKICYQSMLKIAKKANIKEIISFNGLSGATAKYEIIKPIDGMKIIATHKYVDENEKADFGRYNAGNALANDPNIIASKEVNHFYTKS